MPYTEAPFSVNFKPGTGYDAPMLTVRADTVQELEGKLNELANGGVFDSVGRAAAAFKGKYELGGQLGAQTVDHMTPTTPPPAWSGVDPNSPAAQQAPPQQQYGQPAQPQQAQQWGQGAEYPQQQQQSAPAQYGQPQQQQYGQPPQSAPAPQAPPVPGAPLILGMPAKLIDKGSWKAWADPRPQNMTQHLTKDQNTEDPNDPGLANGTRKFWKFIK